MLSFFRRYYSEGDFLSRRVYKAGVYAIPYEGEEVKLHWANADQYYIKTSEFLRDYSYYRILLDRSQEEIATKLEELKATIIKGELKAWEFQGLKTILFGRPLYQSLLYGCR